jgi:hypothetical protein
VCPPPPPPGLCIACFCAVLAHHLDSTTDLMLSYAAVYSCFCVADIDTPPPRLLRAVLAHDLDTITFYDSKGEFVGVRRVGSGKPIKVGLAERTHA